MTHRELLLATALRAYKMHFGHINIESDEGQRCWSFCKRKVFAVLN